MLARPIGGDTMTDQNELFAEVAGVLWSERDLLDDVLYRLTQEQLVLSAGTTRWLNRADDEVRAALERLQLAEVTRAIQVQVLATRLNLPESTTLAELAAIAPEPWPLVLSEHRTALRAAVAEIEAVSAENRRLLQAGAHSIRETLDRLSDAVAGYDANGSAVSYGTGDGAFLLDAQA